LFALDLLVDLFTVDADTAWRVNTQPDLTATHTENGEFDVVMDDKRFTDSS
jgi:hypothetical protein